MTFENKDRLTELQMTLKQIKAVYYAFENEFVSDSSKKGVLLAVENNFENYQNLSSVITDLICKADRQAAELEKETDRETIKAV